MFAVINIVYECIPVIWILRFIFFALNMWTIEYVRTCAVLAASRFILFDVFAVLDGGTNLTLTFGTAIFLAGVRGHARAHVTWRRVENVADLVVVSKIGAGVVGRVGTHVAASVTAALLLPGTFRVHFTCLCACTDGSWSQGGTIAFLLWLGDTCGLNVCCLQWKHAICAPPLH